jgi:glycosyltransferase involved in cell wall biosynthesis
VLRGSSDFSSAYTHRVFQLKNGIEKAGVETDVLYLGEYLIKHPSILLILNIPFIINVLNKYDIICCGGGATSYVIGLAKPFIRGKIVYDIHSNIVAESQLFRKHLFDPIGNFIIFQIRIIDYIARKNADYFITCSEPLVDYYVSKGITGNKIKIIRNGVNINFFKPSRKKIKNEFFTVTYAGGFQPWQGIDTLIDAIKCLDISDIKFKIIGFTTNDRKLKNNIEKTLADRVKLYNQLPRDELIQHLQNSDVLIIPRKFIPPEKAKIFGWSPTKFAEYLAVGRPIIATDLDASSAFLDKYGCGFVCEATANSIADTILKAKETPTETLSEMGTKARELAEEEFNIDLISKAFFNFLSKI